MSSRLKARITGGGTLYGAISSPPALIGRLSAGGFLIGRLSYGTIGSGVEVYSEEYDVVPKVIPQSLNTENKILERDVTIESIPYYKVSNVYDGETAIIGGN